MVGPCTPPPEQEPALTAAVPHPAPDPLLAVVLVALAGPRMGDRVACVGADDLVARGLLAASGTAELAGSDAAVVVACAAYDVPAALALLAPGGRLVAVAPDADAARATATDSGLVLRHVEPVGDQAAWSAVRPALDPAPPPPPT